MKNRNFQGIIQFIFIIAVVVALILLSWQNQNLSQQILQLQQQNNTLSENYKDLTANYQELSANYEELSNSLKNCDALISVLLENTDNIPHQIINISNCITEIYHHIGLHKSNKFPCLECMHMVLG